MDGKVEPESLSTFFILGCPRSGTTMLQQALNRHSRIVLPPETKFFFSFYRRSWHQQRRHWRRIQNDLRINLPPPARPVRSPEEARVAFSRIADAYCRRLGRRRGPEDVLYFGDKTPEHTSRLPWMREAFPDAKILFLYRDGRDVAVSLTTVPWIRCTAYGGMLIWLYYYRFLKQEREHPSPNTLFVRYEDVVFRPQEQFRRILGFLGLDYERPVAEGWGNREGIPERELAWKGRALEPIRPDRVGLWRRRLSDGQLEGLERLGGRALEHLGYELANGAPRGLTPGLAMRAFCELIRTLGQLPIGAVASELAAMARWRDDGRVILPCGACGRSAQGATAR